MNTDKILGLVALTGFLLYLFGTFPNAHGEVQVFARDLAWNDAYSRGLNLYNENCAVCHGDNGQGGVGEDALGLPLNLQSFLVIAPKSYIVNTIRYGRESRGMPAFADDFSESDINAVATFVKGWQIQPSKAIEDGKIKGNVKEGAKWYKVACGNCHGPNGEGGPQETGGGHISASFSGFSAPALADIGFKKSSTDGFVKATLIYGRIGTPMTSYLKESQGHAELEERDINNIVAYIRSMPAIE